MTVSTVDTCWFDAAGTTNIQTSWDPLGPVSNFKTDQQGGTDAHMMLIVVNLTGFDLVVDETYLAFGDLVEQNENSIVAPPAELGPGASGVGFWHISHSAFKNPSFGVKFAANAGTGGQPVYVAGDITEHALVASNKYTASVRNSDHGSSEDYYDNIVSESDEDYDKRQTSEGCASAVGRLFAPVAAVSNFDRAHDHPAHCEVWNVVATITKNGS